MSEVNSNDCIICYLNLEEDIYCTSCKPHNHKFHKACLETWLINSTTCPLCRSHIPEDRNNFPDYSGKEIKNNTELNNSVHFANQITEVIFSSLANSGGLTISEILSVEYLREQLINDQNSREINEIFEMIINRLFNNEGTIHENNPSEWQPLTRIDSRPINQHPNYYEGPLVVQNSSHFQPTNERSRLFNFDLEMVSNTIQIAPRVSRVSSHLQEQNGIKLYNQDQILRPLTYKDFNNLNFKIKNRIRIKKNLNKRKN